MTGSDEHADHVGEVLRERIYGDIGCLGALLLLTTAKGLTVDSDLHPWDTLIDLAVTMSGFWGASLLSHLVSDVIVHGRLPHRREALQLLRTSGQILEATALPVVLLAAAGLGWISASTAVLASIWLLIATLGLFAALAARRMAGSWALRVAFVVTVVGVGVVVVLLKGLHK